MIWKWTILVGFYSLFIVKCFASDLTEKEKKEIDNKFTGFFAEGVIGSEFEENPRFRPYIIRRALTKYYKSERDKFMRLAEGYGIRRIIVINELEGLKVYLDPQYKLDFNFYISPGFHRTEDTKELYDGGWNSLDLRLYTPLLLAVAKNKIDLVKVMISAKLDPKLKLDMPHGELPLVNARSIARKFHDPVKRATMLQILKIDKDKHDLSNVKNHLKDELSISVKEAVLANSVEMVESALLLGNFGDKSDIHVIRWAMINENYLILEMLVIEGYAIPDAKDLPAYQNMKKTDVDFILSKQIQRRPLPYRYLSYFSWIPYNEHSV